ncbi:MAG: four helix bundle protein [Candidatus Wildermuthbacteria bacterium]|nr:four helix bundle protein [Candidatus Wildermuthbacteria bacterium]
MSEENFRNLEERTLEFSKRAVRICQDIPKNTANLELIKQFVRSACSIGANYREANEALGKKDFALRVRISRKEAKETSYWLEILLDANPNCTALTKLLGETIELRKILSAILSKTQS